MLDLYNVLRMVEEEIAIMKKRQQFVIGTYQQQTREDIFKKFVDAEHSLLTITEQKVKELNIDANSIYLIKGNRKEVTLSVRRIHDERSLHVEIEPIIYPTDFNLKFIFDEPSVVLYSPSMTKGIISLNANTVIRATDEIKIITLDEMYDYIDLWIEPAKEGFRSKLNKLINKIGSEEFLMESLLTISKDPPARQLIYLCYEHTESEHTHKIIEFRSIAHIITKHLRL